MQILKKKLLSNVGESAHTVHGDILYENDHIMLEVEK